MKSAKSPFPIRNILHIPETCREAFIPLSNNGCRVLRKAGVRLAGYSEFGEGYLVGRVSPGFRILLFTIEGAGEIYLEHDDGSERREVIPSRTVLSVPAGLKYAYRPIEVPWKVAWFHLESTGRQSASLERDYTIRSYPTAYRVGATMRELIDESLEASVAGEFGEVDDNTKRIEELYAEILLARLQSETCTGKSPASKHSLTTLDSLWNRVSFALDEKWTSSRLAEVSGFSSTHLNRLCRDILGLSTMRHLNALRMERARELLRSTDYPVRQLAGLVGYEDPFAFSTAFKREFGMSPRDCRKGAPS